MIPTKGYIPVKGTINKHPFTQTLVPVKNDNYRLYVNGPMLHGGQLKVGEVARFTIEQDFKPHTQKIAMHKTLKQELQRNKLYADFKKLAPSRQKEILKYFSYLTKDETVRKHIKKLIHQLKNNLPVRIP